MIPNMNYRNLKDSYLFYNIAQKTKAYLEEHPEKTSLPYGDWGRFPAPLRCGHSETP